MEIRPPTHQKRNKNAVAVKKNAPKEAFGTKHRGLDAAFHEESENEIASFPHSFKLEIRKSEKTFFSSEVPKFVFFQGST